LHVKFVIEQEEFFLLHIETEEKEEVRDGFIHTGTEDLRAYDKCQHGRKTVLYVFTLVTAYIAPAAKTEQ